MLHYDRSGYYITPFIDIHQNPRLFVRLICGLTCPNETILGFDTSVLWRNNASGLRIGGTLTVDEGGRRVAYELDPSDTPYVRPSITGRGTTCWVASHPTTKQRVLIKDAWRESEKTPESDFLTAASGVDGVVQMIASQDSLADTQSYRPPQLHEDGFTRRIKSRVVMELCGLSIDKFTSRAQAIGALRDAIVAHRELFQRSVLHRDISMNNILLPSKIDARARARLVDLDMAIWTFTNKEAWLKERPTGTRRFQSISVMNGHPLDQPMPHNYLDDLESFLYVLYHLVMLFESPGVRKPNIDQEFAHWDDENPMTAAIFKHSYMGSGPIRVSAWWGMPCKTLLEGFRDVVLPLCAEKNAIQDDIYITLEEKLEQSEKFAEEESQRSYERVIKLFDEALLAFDREPGVLEVSRAVAQRDGVEPKGSTSKRSAEEALPHPPSQKRTRTRGSTQEVKATLPLRRSNRTKRTNI